MDINKKSWAQWLEAYWAWIAVFVVAASWLLNLGIGWAQLWAGLKASDSETHINAGVFGDMFGAVNALFSGLSIIGIVYAIRQQDQQLKLAREEVKTAQETLRVAIDDANKTKTILEEQHKQLSLQNKATQLQAFENTFFKILENVNYTISEIRNSENSGRSRLNSIKNSIIQSINFHEDENQTALELSQFLERNNVIRNNLSSYVKSITTLIKFVEEHNIENKTLYKELIKSSLSSSEIVIITYYSILDKMFNKKTLYNFIEDQGLRKSALYEIKLIKGQS